MRDFRLSGDDLIREAMAETGRLPYVPDETNTIFGQSTPVLEEDPLGPRRVTVRGIEYSEFDIKTVTLTYEQIDLGVLFQGNFIARFKALGRSSLYELLPELNRGLGINLTEEDVEDINVALLGEGEELNIELRAKPTSRAYKGFTRVVFDRRFILLTDVVLSPYLDIFHHPDGLPTGMTSAGLLTWGLDFSAIHEELEVVSRYNYRRGQWRYHSRLQNQLAELYGIHGWPANAGGLRGEGRLRRYDTRSVANANTDFRYVVTQTHINANGYFGTAYFHFTPP